MAALSGQLMVNPATIDWLKENMWSPIHAIGRYAMTSSSAVNPSRAIALCAVAIRFRCDSIAPFGWPVVPEVYAMIAVSSAPPCATSRSK